MLVSGNQLKAARALAGIDQKELAEQAGVHLNTIQNMEAAGAEPIGGREKTRALIQHVLERAGIRFTNIRNCPGVWIGPPPRALAYPAKPHGLDAPGFKWSKRRNGQCVAYWVCRRDLAKLYPIKPVRLWPVPGCEAPAEPTAADWGNISERCCAEQAKMLRWESDPDFRREMRKAQRGKLRRPRVLPSAVP